MDFVLYFHSLRGMQGIVLIASGTYNAGQGMVNQAEEDFARAFKFFAPVRRDDDSGNVCLT